MTNFVLMASVSDVSLSSQSVSFDGKSKILCASAEVLVGEDDVENTAPILRVLARIFERNSSTGRDTNIAAPLLFNTLRALEKILKRKRHKKSQVVLAKLSLSRSRIQTQEICAATFYGIATLKMTVSCLEWRPPMPCMRGVRSYSSHRK